MQLWSTMPYYVSAKTAARQWAERADLEEVAKAADTEQARRMASHMARLQGTAATCGTTNPLNKGETKR